MKFALQYLWEHKTLFFLEGGFVGIFAVVFYLYHLPLEAVLYPALLCLVAGCLYTGYCVYKAYKKHKKLQAMRSMQGRIMQELFEEEPTICEEDYQELIRSLNTGMQYLEDKMTGSYEEMMDYFTVWVHQIKTPIASMHLQLGEEDSKLARSLSSELLRIEQYVEMVLTYLRIGSDVSDYVFRTVSLDDILRETIRKFRGDFIMKRLHLVYTPVDQTVVSDEKWLSFVISQILSNALKYTKEGSVTISMQRPGLLCIRDTGIGIAEEDIPRIFDKGYTGANGRADKRASGLGLYLCKQICDRLGHEISVSSKEGEGTTVQIDFVTKM